jgi:hypothetical protein
MVAFTFSDPAFLRPASAPPPSGVAPVYLGNTVISSFGGPHNHTAPASLASGQRYVILVGWEGDAVGVTVTVNGTAATARGTEFEARGKRTRAFEVVPGSTGTTVTVQRATGNFALISHVHYVQIANGATFQAAVNAGVVNNADLVIDLSQNVGANDSVIALASGDTASVTWVGATVAGTSTSGTSRASCAIAEDVAAATPRTVTAERAATGPDAFVGVAVRYSA